ncbi:MAG: M56 family metallopeptidase [Nitritalea sp.]
MELLLKFLWQGTAILLIGGLFYRLWLARLTFFEWNRAYLLLVGGLALLVPFLSWQLPAFFQPEQLPYLSFPEVGVSPDAVVHEAVTRYSPWELVGLVYLAGVALVWLRLGVGIWNLRRQLNRARVYRRFGVTLYVSPQFRASSFFGSIMLSPEELEHPELRAIISHELEHVHRYHSIDRLFWYLLKGLFWFNPFVYMLEKELVTLHEYEVDEALQAKVDRAQYAHLLLQQLELGLAPVPVNTFNQFQLKQRIMMMFQSKSPANLKKRFAQVTPLLVAIALLFACEAGDEGSSPLNENQLEQSDQMAALSENGRENLGEVFDVVEQPPMPAGGMEGWSEYLTQNLVYPDAARRAGIEGTVYLVFEVSKTGSIHNVEILRGIGGGCDEEAIRVVSQAQNWNPGKQRGQEVNVRMRLPVKFKLS